MKSKYTLYTSSIGIFMIWTHTEDELRTFMTYLNNIHPTIKFTSSHSTTFTSFLDVKVSLSQFGKVETDLYTKPTGKRQCLLQSSCHPLHIYRRNEPFHSSSLSAYDAYGLPTKASHYAPMNSYNTIAIVDTTSQFFKREIQRVHAIACNEKLKLSQRCNTNQHSRVSLVITDNPVLRSISGIIQRYFKILSSSHDTTTFSKSHLLLLSDEPTF